MCAATVNALFRIPHFGRSLRSASIACGARSGAAAIRQWRDGGEGAGAAATPYCAARCAHCNDALFHLSSALPLLCVLALHFASLSLSSLLCGSLRPPRSCSRHSSRCCCQQTRHQHTANDVHLSRSALRYLPLRYLEPPPCIALPAAAAAATCYLLPSSFGCALARLPSDAANDAAHRQTLAWQRAKYAVHVGRARGMMTRCDAHPDCTKLRLRALSLREERGRTMELLHCMREGSLVGAEVWRSYSFAACLKIRLRPFLSFLPAGIRQIIFSHSEHCLHFCDSSSGSSGSRRQHERTRLEGQCHCRGCR